MACKTCKSTPETMRGTFTPSGEQKKILSALKALGEPVANASIAKSSGLDGKLVSENMKTLRAEGLVESPMRCKYVLSQTGEKYLK